MNSHDETLYQDPQFKEVYLYEREIIEEGRSRISYFINTLYIRKRLHSALNYRPPTEFEQIKAS